MFLPILAVAQIDEASQESVPSEELSAAMDTVATKKTVSVKVDTVATKKPADKKWYDRFEIRGYIQFRYNELLQTNEDLTCEQCDRFWGGDGGFGIRRTRIIFSGQISNNIYFYIQPDLQVLLTIPDNILHNSGMLILMLA